MARGTQKNSWSKKLEEIQILVKPVVVEHFESPSVRNANNFAGQNSNFTNLNVWRIKTQTKNCKCYQTYVFLNFFS